MLRTPDFMYLGIYERRTESH
jgi:hypothetical protein